jgi:hypothetical protein
MIENVAMLGLLMLKRELSGCFIAYHTGANNLAPNVSSPA